MTEEQAVRRLSGLWNMVLMFGVPMACGVILVIQQFTDINFGPKLIELPEPAFWGAAVAVMAAGAGTAYLLGKYRLTPEALVRYPLQGLEAGDRLESAEARIRVGTFIILSPLDAPAILLLVYSLVSQDSLPLVLAMAYSLVVGARMKPDFRRLLRETSVLLEEGDGENLSA